MEKNVVKKSKKNHSTQDSRVVPHRGTNWAALRLTAQIERDAVLSKSYGRGCSMSQWKGLYAITHAPSIDKVCLRVMLTGATGRRSVPQPAPMTYPLDFMSMSFGPYPPSEEPMARSRRSPDHS